MHEDKIGSRIRELFSRSPVQATVIAPFIKVNALESVLAILPDASHFYCVTRWLAQDIVQGVSDLEVLDVIESRRNGTLALVDNLHAKLYVADNACLVGSSNVTLSGFGDIGEGNIEVLVETTVDDPGVSATLSEIARSQRPATRELAEQLRQRVELLDAHANFRSGQPGWIPLSFKPEMAFALYSQLSPTHKPDLLLDADRIVLEDIFRADILPGNSEVAFTATIRERLAAIPPAARFLQGTTDQLLTFGDLDGYFSHFKLDDYSNGDLWRAFVNWMSYFYPERVMKQEVVEIALRRARRIV